MGPSCFHYWDRRYNAGSLDDENGDPFSSIPATKELLEYLKTSVRANEQSDRTLAYFVSARKATYDASTQQTTGLALAGSFSVVYQQIKPTKQTTEQILERPW
jgi:hypothetical protein